MAAIVIRKSTKATRLPGIAGVPATAPGRVQRALDHAAATVMICAAGAALLQLLAQIASFPAPLAVTVITLIAADLLRSLRQHRCTRARHRPGPDTGPAPRR